MSGCERGGLSVPQLHALAQLDRTGEGSPSQKQIDAWKTVAREVDQHAAALRAAADQLAMTWPPARSEAAAQFSKFVADFIASMRTTRDRADAIATALSGIDASLNTAKAELSRLNAQWRDSADTSPENKTDSWRGTTASGMPYLPGSPVPDDWQERLNDRASTVLRTLNGSVAEALATMKAPPQYTAAIDFSREHQESESRPSQGIATEPRSSASSPPQSLVPQIPPLAQPFAPASSPGVAQPSADKPSWQDRGPTLTGTAVSPAPPAALEPPPVDSPSLASPLTDPMVTPISSRTARTRRPEGGVFRGGFDPLRDNNGSARNPIGGIYGTPDRGIAPSGRDGAPQRQIFPSSGSLGGNGVRETGRVISGAPTSFSSARTANTPGNRPSHQRDDKPVPFDPNDPWQVARGVPPVIDAADEPDRHDPGPGVIGVDR